MYRMNRAQLPQGAAAWSTACRDRTVQQRIRRVLQARVSDGQGGHLVWVQPASKSLPCQETVAQALEGDVFGRYMHGEDREARLSSVRAFISSSMLGKEHMHRVYMTANCECAMFVYPYPEGEPSEEAAAASVDEEFLQMDQERAKNAKAVLDLYERTKSELHQVHGSFLVINFFGTLPAHQRKGLGAAVMRKALEDADQAGLPMFLFTFNTNDSVVFYKKNGFRMVTEMSIEGSDVTAYYMFRGPVD